MARRSRINLTVAEVALPPDTRPVGPFTNNLRPWSGERDPLSGGAIGCSDVMGSRSGGREAAWEDGIRTVSAASLSRGQNPLFRGNDGQEENKEARW
jgi:hypothetical protein